MSRVNSRLVVVLGLTGLLVAGGCGNKGPLYLPEREAGQPAPPPDATAPEKTAGDEDEEGR